VALIVQKYGGTSVGDPERIRNVARRIVDTVKAGHRVAVVVSAMSGQTDRLVALARELGGDDPDPREYDVIVSTGEQVTIALLAMAIQRLGQPARSFTGAQMGMRTDTAHKRARIESIDTGVLRDALERGQVAVLAGFQGIDEAGNITTLGRGGSDTSAVAVAAALRADVCEIYTDVDGVYTADPRIVPGARKLERISYDEMLEMASLGAKVLQIRSVRFAMRYAVPLHVRSSFNDSTGTWVVPEEQVMEQLVVSGVTYNRNEAKIRVRGVRDVPGVAARLFSPLAADGVVVDMIIQNLSQDGATDLTFTVPRDAYARSLELTRKTGREIGAQAVDGDPEIAKVSIVGMGMRDHAGVATRMFQVLADEGINIQLISTSEIKVSVVIEEKYTELAVRALHAAFVEAGAAAPAAERPQRSAGCWLAAALLAGRGAGAPGGGRRPRCDPPSEREVRGTHTVRVRCDGADDRAELRGTARVRFGLGLDRNLADAPALEALPGSGPERAEATGAGRAHGADRSRSDLGRVRGIGPVPLRRAAPRLASGAAGPAARGAGSLTRGGETSPEAP
jgi:aspartate kinase